MAFPDDLLEQARHLAQREPKRPRQASLRRAVSTAYYALFHFLTTEAVANWKVAAQRPRLARTFEHGRMKEACRAASKYKPGDGSTSARHLRSIANAFVQLYDARRTADYDNSTQWSRTEALTQIDLAEQAFADWRTMGAQEITNDFLFSLFVKERQ